MSAYITLLLTQELFIVGIYLKSPYTDLQGDLFPPVVNQNENPPFSGVRCEISVYRFVPECGIQEVALKPVHWIPLQVSGNEVFICMHKAVPL